MILDQLAGSIGDKHVVPRADLGGRAIDVWTSAATEAMALLRPGSVEEVSRVLALCHEAGQGIVPEGGRTNLVRGTEAGPDEILLSLERMNRIERVDPRGRAVTVEAGAVLQRVQEAAENADLRLGLDFGARGSAMIGGALATNAGGTQVMRYGMARDQVLGLEAVLADGTVLSHLNPYSKDNTGYDLKQLFIGSEGTLGVITRAVLRLHPRPSSMDTAFLAFEDFDSVVLMLSTLGSGLGGTLSSYEVLWRDFYDLNPGEASSLRPPVRRGYPYYVLCEAEGFDATRDRERFEAAIGAALEAGQVADAAVAQSGREREAFWRIREDFELELKLFPIMVDFDVSLAVETMERFGEDLARKLADRVPENRGLHIFGHLGDGNLHLATGIPDAALKTKVQDLVYDLVAAHGGSVSAEHGIGLAKARFLGYSRSAAEIDLMRRLKQTLDPKRILNRGKVLG
jgi:FAD/FMN-containing dehydrogenase